MLAAWRGELQRASWPLAEFVGDDHLVKEPRSTLELSVLAFDAESSVV
jgi:hypothetical protein